MSRAREAAIFQRRRDDYAIACPAECGCVLSRYDISGLQQVGEKFPATTKTRRNARIKCCGGEMKCRVALSA
jgi:hypothetical protein